jgi:hypothetical protein
MSDRFVNLSTSAADLAGTQDSRLRLNFPSTGGMQGVDANGALVTFSPGTGASLTANNTFTGRNTFDPAPATGLSVLNAGVLFDFSSPQTLNALATDPFGSFRIEPGTVNGTAPGTTVDLLASVLIVGAPTVGTNLTATDGTYGLAVDGGIFASSLDMGGTLTFGGSAGIAKAGDLTINLSGGGTTALNVSNSGAGVANLNVDGVVRSASLLTMDGTAGSITQTSGNLTISTSTPAVLSLSVGAAGSLQLGGNSAALLGFFATAPAARPTGVLVSAAGIHAALVTLGLITA